MKTIQINDHLSIKLLDDFKPTPIRGRNAWIAALRSGKYKQGKHVLRNLQDEYCCLGVKRDLEGAKWEKYTLDNFYEDNNNTGCYSGPEPLGTNGNLSVTVIFNGDYVKCLTALNDCNATFDEIASVIEIYYEEATTTATPAE